MKKIYIYLSFMCGFYGFSQTITVGTGTDVNTTTTASPVNIYYRRQISQMIYTAAELNAAGFTGATAINKLGFFVENAPIYAIPDYTIKIMHTASVNVSLAINSAAIQTVKGPYTYLPVAGDWDMIDLDAPFNWNGADNILIEICWSQIAPTWNSSGECRIFPSIDGYRYLRDDAAGNICGDATINILNNKPQIRFTAEETTTWEGNVSNLWSNSLNWTNGLPDEFMDAIIPASVTTSPLIIGLAECNSLLLDGILTMEQSGNLNIFGDMLHNGTFVDGDGQLTFIGNNTSVLDNQAALEINDLTIANKGGLTLAGNQIILKGSLELEQSTLNTNNILTLRSDVNGTARIGELKSNCLFTLEMEDTYGDGWNGGFIELFYDGLLIQTFAASGFGTTVNFSVPKGTLFELFYTGGAWETENSYNLIDQDGATVFNDGTSPNIGLAYGATADCQFIEVISGDIIMERYVDAGGTYWRNIGSAVQGATIDQFNDDFATAGYPGSLFPNFGWISAYHYDETLNNFNGYLSPTGSDVLNAGQGWQIYSGDNLIGTDPFTFDLKGVPNQGPIALPVSYTVGTDGLDGWSLVANPYASTIDWDATQWEKVNVGGAIYILDPDTEQYTTYVNGASTNSGSPLIASQQSFWVRAFDAGPELIADEAVKVSTDQAFIKSSAFNPGMTVRFGDSNGFDEIVIRDLVHANDEFEFEIDAEKYWSASNSNPQLSVINGEQKDLTVHSFNKGFEEWSLPVRALAVNDGVYYLEFINTQEINVPCMYIEDSFTGDSYAVTEGVSYDFMMSDTTTVPRFILHIGKNFILQTTDIKCYGQATGEVLVNLDSSQVNYELTNLTGFNYTDTDLGNPFYLNNLEGGSYHLEFFGADNLCGQTIFDFVITEPSAIQTNSNITSEINGNDGSIELMTYGGTPPYIFEWSHGPIEDSIYNLASGLYQVKIYDINHCLSIVNLNVNSILGITNAEQDYNVIFAKQDNSITVTGLKLDINETFYIVDMRGRTLPVNYIVTGPDSFVIQLSTMTAGVYSIFTNSNKGFKYRFFIE